MDWQKIRTEYINGYISYRKLAEKHNIPYQTLRDRATKGKWFVARKEQRENIGKKTAQKSAEKIAEQEAKRMLRINNAADKLLEKIEQATEQLDQFIVTNKVKQKEVKYSNSKAGFGKPDKETIKEVEKKSVVKADHLDRMGLKQLASALRDLKDIQFTGDEDKTIESPNINITIAPASPDDIEDD